MTCPDIERCSVSGLPRTSCQDHEQCPVALDCEHDGVEDASDCADAPTYAEDEYNGRIPFR